MKTAASAGKVDFEKFRLRRFVERLIEIGEVEVHEEPVPLARLAAIMESTPKATLFKRAGPENFEIVAAVSGSRKRLAAAFGVDGRSIAHEYMRRMNQPHPVVEIPSADAPVHQVIIRGDDVDLTKLPFHPQHEYDGGTMAKLGFDLTKPLGRSDDIEAMVASAPRFDKTAPRFPSVRAALESGPKYFAEIMRSVGSEDGREVALELDRPREQGVLERVAGTGQWTLRQTADPKEGRK